MSAAEERDDLARLLDEAIDREKRFEEQLGTTQRILTEERRWRQELTLAINAAVEELDSWLPSTSSTLLRNRLESAVREPSNPASGPSYDFAGSAPDGHVTSTQSEALGEGNDPASGADE